MDNEYTTKEMKPTEMKEPKPSTMESPALMDDGNIYKERGLYHFKWKGEVYTYMSKQKAEAGLLIING